jgi:serine/threonine protein phosphatase PrpC
MRYTVYEGSRKGGRPVNEDRVGYSYTNESLVMVLADGMGGHSRGDLAAEILVREVLKMFRDLARPDLPNCQEFLLDAVYAAHASINEHALQQRMSDTPRTTCVVCVVQRGQGLVGACRRFPAVSFQPGAANSPHRRSFGGAAAGR